MYGPNGTGAAPSNVTVTNNRFGPTTNSGFTEGNIPISFYGYSTLLNSRANGGLVDVLSGNVIDHTGAPLPVS